MKTFRTTIVAVTTAALVLLLASPAWAHEEINTKTIPTGSPTFLTLTAANESSTDITKVVLTAPKGLVFGEATKSPSGWTAAHTDTTITWSGGKVAPESFENFGFELDNVAQPGTLAFGVALGTEQVTVNVTSVAPGSIGATTTAAPASTTTVVTAPVPTTLPADLAKDVDDAKSTASTAAILGAIGIGLAVVAIVVAIAMAGRGKRPEPEAQDF